MSSAPTHVAVGVVWRDGKILITRRADHAHQGGLWEFPGGKLEQGETVQAALRRELHEEVGILTEDAEPLIKIDYHYPDKRVILDVWQVHGFSGTATAREGQPLQWVEPGRLVEYRFPAANQPIIKAAILPDRYAILDASNLEQLEQRLASIVNHRIRLVQLRLKALPNNLHCVVLPELIERCRRQGMQVLLNSDLAIADADCDGLHLSGRSLRALKSRPAHCRWLAASCHNLDELRHAEAIGADFAVLAPVLPTTSHPGAPVLGWQGFRRLVEQVNLPVYALGGLSAADLAQARAVGGQGIAAISAFAT